MFQSGYFAAGYFRAFRTRVVVTPFERIIDVSHELTALDVAALISLLTANSQSRALASSWAARSLAVAYSASIIFVPAKPALTATSQTRSISVPPSGVLAATWTSRTLNATPISTMN